MGYQICSFREMPATWDPERSRMLLLRHDLDHSLRSALPIARIEHEMGVCATYFVQIACPFYNLLAPEGRDIVARLVEMGHEVGLHYDTRRYEGPTASTTFRTDCALLEMLTGVSIVSASQHIPVDSLEFEVGRFVQNNAYAPRFTTGPMTYISDSLMRWRGATPHDLLDAGRSFQLLVHPMKWVGDPAFADMSEALDHALAEEIQNLETLHRDVDAYYKELLRKREALDAEFRRRHRHFDGGKGSGE